MTKRMLPNSQGYNRQCREVRSNEMSIAEYDGVLAGKKQERANVASSQQVATRILRGRKYIPGGS